MTAMTLHTVPIDDDLRLNVAVEGSGPAIVLVHGFPHTWEVWAPVIADLASTHTVIAPDLRGFGASSLEAPAYTAGDVTSDLVGILDALDVDQADVVAFDLGTPAAFLLAMTHPERVRRLVLMEALVGSLPGAEEFLRAGPPWWFGFHAVPGFAERVLEGNEKPYVDFFLTTGTLGAGASDAFVAAAHEAFSRPGALRAAFEHYRALPDSAAQIADAVANSRLTVPTLALGASTVGDATYRQLEPVTDSLTGLVLDETGHIIPQHRPAELLAAVREFLH